MNEQEQYNMLCKYHAAIYWSKRNPEGFSKNFRETIAEYRKSDEYREAHRIVQRFANSKGVAKRGRF